MDLTIVAEIGKGILLGASAALIGYIKNLPDGEAFDWKKPMPTIIIGGIAGVVSHFMGLQLDAATELLAQFGVISVINSLWSALMKEFKQKSLIIKIKKS